MDSCTVACSDKAEGLSNEKATMKAIKMVSSLFNGDTPPFFPFSYSIQIPDAGTEKAGTMELPASWNTR
jgi:hypothetical protein